MKRKICVFTGTRAEYGLLKPIMKAIDSHPNLQLIIIATGMHLSKKYGYTYNEIIKDGFKEIFKIYEFPKNETELEITRSIGNQIIKTSKLLSKIKPDFFLVLGDRYETLAGTIAAAYLNIPIAHIHGGDISSGGLDEPARHSISKFASVHFPATKKSAERLIKMGEDKWRINVVGAPALDTILNQKLLDKSQIKQKYNIDLNKRTILLVQHPVSTSPKESKIQFDTTLKALDQFAYQKIIIYPNNDSGNENIIKEIEKLKGKKNVYLFKTLPHIVYLSLLNHIDVMIGNSSSGMIESASFKLPVVNIGIRQEGRERSTNVIDVPHNKEKIIKAIKKATSKEFIDKIKTCKNSYGEGKAGIKIANILNNIEINKKLIQKKLIY